MGQMAARKYHQKYDKEYYSRPEVKERRRQQQRDRNARKRREGVKIKQF